MPVSTASKKFGVPKTTLLYKKRGIYPPTILRRGPDSILGLDNENRLVEWILHMHKNRFPITKEQLLNSVQMLLNEMKKETPFTDNRPGRHWYAAFLQRHKELTLPMSQNHTHNRASVTKEKLRVWFHEIDAHFREKHLTDLDASRVFNCDETAFLLNPKGPRALVPKGEKTVYSFTTGDERECLTTLFCGNANGQLLPPMVMFTYQRIPHNIAATMPPGWGMGRSDTGWMTSETFYDYVVHVFHPWLVENNIEFPVVLYLDGHTSHLTFALSNFCRENNIELVALYPNSTHILRPLDVAMFHPLKETWPSVVREWRSENCGERLKRQQFAPMLEKALAEVDVPSNLQNGFRATGLYPLSADAINYSKDVKPPVIAGDKMPPLPRPPRQINRAKMLEHLRFIESNIDDNVLQMFNNLHGASQWTGPSTEEGLFYFWQKVKNLATDNDHCHSDYAYFATGDNDEASEVLDLHSFLVS